MRHDGEESRLTSHSRTLPCPRITSGSHQLGPVPGHAVLPGGTGAFVAEICGGLARCQELVASQDGRKKFRFKNKLMSLDGSIIDLRVSMFNWACAHMSADGRY